MDIDDISVEKIFFGLPKIFGKKFKACIYEGQYALYILAPEYTKVSCLVYNNIYENNVYEIDHGNFKNDYAEQIRKFYCNKHLCLDDSPMLEDEIKALPAQLKHSLMKTYARHLNKLLAQNMKYGNKTKIALDASLDAYVTICASSIEEILVLIDVNAGVV